jgi:hypothetical protein
MLLDLAFPTYKNPFSPLSVLLSFSICAEAKSIVKGETKYEDTATSVTNIIGIRINRNKNELLFSFFNIAQ